MRIGASEALGAVVARAREAAGVRQGDLAATIGVSAWVLNKVECGKRSFDTDWLRLMPDATASAIREYIGQEIGFPALTGTGIPPGTFVTVRQLRR